MTHRSHQSIPSVRTIRSCSVTWHAPGVAEGKRQERSSFHENRAFSQKPYPTQGRKAHPYVHGARAGACTILDAIFPQGDSSTKWDTTCFQRRKGAISAKAARKLALTLSSSIFSVSVGLDPPLLWYFRYHCTWCYCAVLLC